MPLPIEPTGDVGHQAPRGVAGRGECVADGQVPKAGEPDEGAFNNPAGGHRTKRLTEGSSLFSSPGTRACAGAP